jgi:uncharacterized protein
MALAEEIITSRYSISGYDPGLVSINEQDYRHSLILSPSELLEDWPVSHISELTAALIEPVYAMKPDVILLGTGEKQIFPDPVMLGLFAQKGVGVEVMNTPALCRTFNILIAEDRNVVAAIIL